MFPNWVYLSLVSLVGFGVVNAGFKYVSGDDPVEAAFFIYFSAAAATLLVVLATDRSLPSGTTPVTASVLGLFSLVATVAAIYAVRSAPNPGYVAAIFSTNVVLVALVSVPLFGSRLEPENVAGIVLAVVAIFLITK